MLATGRITIDSRGMPRIHYSIAPADQQSMLEVSQGLPIAQVVPAGAHMQGQRCQLKTFAFPHAPGLEPGCVTWAQARNR